MLHTIAFLELNSIAKGVQVADALLKAADTRLLFAKAICPGKFVIMISGEVAAVSASLEVGVALGEQYVVDSVVIPMVHPQVIQAINAATTPTEPNAIGVMEFFSITAAVYAADAAVKAAEVQLLDVRLGTGIGGKSFVTMCGDVSAVSEATRCGVAKASEEGLTVTHVVIPNPSPEIFEALL